VISILLLAAGVTMLVLTPGTGNAPGAANQAFTNAAETRQVTAAVSGDVAGIFSYDYTDLAATTNEAHQVLAGQAAAQYAELSTMLQSAASEKLIVSTKVTAIGVRTLTSGSATLLVFLQQNSTRAGTPAGSVAAQLQVTAQLTDGRWLITSIAAPQD
jgi:Mce-associated membrane protein